MSYEDYMDYYNQQAERLYNLRQACLLQRQSWKSKLDDDWQWIGQEFTKTLSPDDHAVHELVRGFALPPENSNSAYGGSGFYEGVGITNYLASPFELQIVALRFLGTPWMLAFDLSDDREEDHGLFDDNDGEYPTSDDDLSSFKPMFDGWLNKAETTMSDQLMWVKMGVLDNPNMTI